MKSIKFLLAAFAISTVFAACTKEEMVATQESVPQKDVYAGAVLVGSGISMNFDNGVETKLVGSTWETTDKLGLAWIVTEEGYNAYQDSTKAVTPLVYANHLFEKPAADKSFATKGNVYEGWHFAYYPFAYQNRPGSDMKIDINPAQKEVYKKDRYNTALHLSARGFISNDKHHLDENYQLQGMTFEMLRAVNTIAVTVNPTEDFTNSEALKDLAINKITFDTKDARVFYTQPMTLDPTELAAMVYNSENPKNVVYDSKKTNKGLLASFDEALGLGSDAARQTTVNTNIENEEINLSGAQTLRIYTLPYAPQGMSVNYKKAEFTINVDGGVFTVKYTDPELLEEGEELTQAQKDNNEALKDFAANFNKDGALTKYHEDVTKSIVKVNLVLTPDMFEADFSNINSEKAWNQAVAVANALKLTNTQLASEPFVIKPGKNNKAWKFEDVDGDGNLINLPSSSKVIVNGTMVMGADGEWPAKGIKADKVTVNKGVTLTVKDGVTLNAVVDNNGTITVGKEAVVKTVNNKDGRINVVNGSIAILDDSKNQGTIAYTLTGNDKASEINELTAPVNKTEYLVANVNTLVVNDGITFNLSMKDADAGTIYNPVVGQKLERMHLMTFELNNGTIKANPLSGAEVKTVKVNSGENNSILSVNISEKLSVVAGKVVVDAVAVNNSKEGLNIFDIDNNAELVANVDVYTKNISNPKGAQTTVIDEKTVWYTHDYTQGGTANGNISKAVWDGVVDEVVPVVEGGKNVYSVSTPDQLVWLAQQNKVNSSKIVLMADIDMSGVNWTKGIHAGDGDFETVFDGNGKTISNLNGTSGLINYAVGTIKNLTIDGANIVNNDFAGVLANNSYASVEGVTIKNVTVKGSKRVGAIIGIHNGGSLKNCSVDKAYVSGDCYSAGVLSGFVNETSTNRVYESCTITNSAVSATLKGALTGAVNGVTLTVKGITVKNTTPAEYVGGLYNGGKVVTVK